MKKGIGRLVFGMAAAGMQFMAQAHAGEGAMHSMAKDERAAIVLAPAARNMVLAEMRQFLTGVQAMTTALSNDDLAMVAKTAHSLGMQAAHEVPPEVKAKLPKEFKQFGFEVHSDFDRLALDAESLGDSKHAMKQMGDILQKCVACHNMYRIDSDGGKVAKN